LFLAALGSPLRSALRCSVPHQILFPTLNPSLVGFVFPKTRLLCHQLVSSSRFVAACGPLRSDLGIRYVSFAEYAIRRLSSACSPRGLDSRSLFFVRRRCWLYRFWILHLFASRSAIQLLLSCVGSFLGARVGLVFSVHCCNQDLVFHAVWSSVLCQLIFLRVKATGTGFESSRPVFLAAVIFLLDRFLSIGSQLVNSDGTPGPRWSACHLGFGWSSLCSLVRRPGLSVPVWVWIPFSYFCTMLASSRSCFSTKSC
jgi:hypothetical protein